MSECPECGAILRPQAKRCRCGWEAEEKPKATGYPCLDCAHPTSMKDGAIVVDGRYLCTACRWRRMESGADPKVAAQASAVIDAVGEGMKLAPTFKRPSKEELEEAMAILRRKHLRDKGLEEIRL